MKEKYKVLRKDLLENFTKDEIELFIKEGAIKKNNGIYYYEHLRTLTAYAKSLFSRRKMNLGDRFIELCYKIDSTFLPITSTIFLRCIQEGNFQESLKYLRELLKCPNPKFHKNYMLYLFLLSTFTKLPDDLRLIAINMKKKDVLFSRQEQEEIYSGQKLQQIHLVILTQKFREAQKLLTSGSKEETSNSNNFLLLLLLNKAKEAQIKRKEILEDYIEKENYKGAILFLEKESMLHLLSSMDKFSLKVLYDMERLNLTGSLTPKKLPPNGLSENIYTAIDERDYKKVKTYLDQYGSNYQAVISDITRRILNKQGELEEKTVIQLSDEERLTLFKNLYESNISIKGISRILDLPYEKSLKYMIILASNYYDEGETLKGDELLQKVNLLPQNSEYLKELYQNTKTKILNMRKLGSL